MDTTPLILRKWGAGVLKKNRGNWMFLAAKPLWESLTLKNVELLSTTDGFVVSKDVPELWNLRVYAKDMGPNLVCVKLLGASSRLKAAVIECAVSFQFRRSDDI